MTLHSIRGLLLCSGALAIAGCGGGGGGGTNFIPPPPVTPAPPPAPAPTPSPAPTPTPTAAPIRIFAAPTVGQYATVGASIAGPGGNLDNYSSASVTFGLIATDDANQAHIRYTADGTYEVQLPGSDWDRLIAYGGSANADPATNNYFQPASVATNLAYLITTNARNSGYSYSELAGWGSRAAGRWGYVAFGVPTPAGGVPVSGSASFSGLVNGNADIMFHDGLLGGYDTSHLSGTVQLNFDFAAGKLGGSMTLTDDDLSPALNLGVFQFANTVFGVGANTYSGTFETSASGQNFFLGRFTGPNAQETIGAWGVPFVFSGDGQTHQAFGAWIAKQ